MQVSKFKLVELIKSCEFLGKNVILEWENNLEFISSDFYSLIYSSFESAKNRVDALYMQFALNHDSENILKKNLTKKLSSASKLVRETQLKNISRSVFI